MYTHKLWISRIVLSSPMLTGTNQLALSHCSLCLTMFLYSFGCFFSFCQCSHVCMFLQTLGEFINCVLVSWSWGEVICLCTHPPTPVPSRASGGQAGRCASQINSRFTLASPASPTTLNKKEQSNAERVSYADGSMCLRGSQSESGNCNNRIPQRGFSFCVLLKFSVWLPMNLLRLYLRPVYMCRNDVIYIMKKQICMECLVTASIVEQSSILHYQSTILLTFLCQRISIAIYYTRAF